VSDSQKEKSSQYPVNFSYEINLLLYLDLFSDLKLFYVRRSSLIKSNKKVSISPLAHTNCMACCLGLFAVGKKKRETDTYMVTKRNGYIYD